MIYFDNAATTKNKPEEVYNAFNFYLREVGVSPGRGSYSLGIKASRMLYLARKNIGNYFGLDKKGNVYFTKNSTEALNGILNGILKKGDHVVITCYEHNAVLRPIHKLMEKDIITYDIIKMEDINKKPEEIYHKYFTKNTRLYISTLASNLTGRMIFDEKLFNYLRKRNIRTLLDASQGAGKIALNMTEQSIDYLAFTSHKDLLGIPGAGGLCCSRVPDWDPLVEGGTGIYGDLYTNPRIFPEGYEAGTLNMPAIWALSEAVSYCRDHEEDIKRKDLELVSYAQEKLKGIDNVTIYDTKFEKVGVIAFNVSNFNSSDVVKYLDEKGICVRGGIHCAVLPHEALKTVETGAIRISFSYTNTLAEIDKFLLAIEDLR